MQHQPETGSVGYDRDEDEKGWVSVGKELKHKHKQLKTVTEVDHSYPNLLVFVLGLSSSFHFPVISYIIIVTLYPPLAKHNTPHSHSMSALHHVCACVPSMWMCV